jgi:flagellar basal-body rod protein FlgG
MNLSFYTAAVGAKAQQTRMDIIGNNIANINTDGYKTQNAGFVDLLYEKYYKAATEDPETGSGARVEKTDILHTQGGMMETGGTYDFCIVGEGFFAVYDNATGEVFYTRNGNFSLSNYSNENNAFYLANEQGYVLIDSNRGLILVDPLDESMQINPGVFDFNSKEGMLLVGNSLFQPAERNGQPLLNEEAQVIRGRIELSNVDLAQEMSRVIEAQRAYSLTLKMVQTSDEVETTIINLR